jgi:hypothetical protein
MIFSDEGRKKVLEQVVKCTARVRAKKAIGSGTVVYSNGGNTYLLTNHHVVEDCIEYKQVWDNLLRRDVKKDFFTPVELDFGRFDDNGRFIASSTVLADIVLYDKSQDLALLKVRDNIDYQKANLYQKDDAEKVPLLVPLCACGAAMGEKPVVTFGTLNGVQIEIDGYEYWLSSAQSVFGVSGGGVYTRRDDDDNWYFLGVPSRVSVVFIGFGGSPVTHMGYFIPIFRIYRWLEEYCYQFIYDDNYTIDQCERMREEKKERELAIYMRSQAGEQS